MYVCIMKKRKIIIKPCAFQYSLLVRHWVRSGLTIEDTHVGYFNHPPHGEDLKNGYFEIADTEEAFQKAVEFFGEENCYE